MYYTIEVQKIKDYFSERGKQISNTTGNELNDFMIVKDYEFAEIKIKSEIIINDWLSRSGFANSKSCGDVLPIDYITTTIEEAFLILCYDLKYTCLLDENESIKSKESRQQKNAYLYLRNKGVL